MSVSPIRGTPTTAATAAPFTPVHARQSILSTLSTMGSENAAEATAAAEAVPAADTNVVSLRAYFTALTVEGSDEEKDRAAQAALAGLDDASRATLFTDLYARLGGVPVEGHDVAADHVAATPRSDEVKAAAQALLTSLVPVVEEEPVVEPAASKGFIASVCDRISSFFTGIANWFASFFKVTAVPAEDAAPTQVTLVSSAKEFQGTVNAEGADAEVVLAAYAAFCAQFPEAKDAIEYRIYQAAQGAGEDVSSATYGTDYVAAQPTGTYVKAALTSYVADLEAAPAAETPAAAPAAA